MEGSSRWTLQPVQMPWKLEHDATEVAVTLAEADGLQPNELYVFSMRVGDLHCLSKWSPSTAAVTLALPPPVVDPRFEPHQVQIRVDELMDNRLRVVWTPFVPVLAAGIPPGAQVEYLLTVAQCLEKNDGCTVANPHSAVLVVSPTVSKDASPAEIARANGPLSLALGGLAPNTAYELMLHVRYARLGTRQWSGVLRSSVTTTDVQKTSAHLEKNNLGDVDLNSEKTINPLKRSWHSVSPRCLDRNTLFMKSSQKHLPPLDMTSVGKRSCPTVGMLEELMPSEVEAWVKVFGAEHIMGGNVTTAFKGNLGARVPEVTMDNMGPDEVPSSQQTRRHKAMSTRPAMPMMPRANHPSVQLDLCGRSVPFPPRSDVSVTAGRALFG